MPTLILTALVACGLHEPNPQFDDDARRDPMSTVADQNDNGVIQPASVNSSRKDAQPGVHPHAPNGRAVVTLRTAEQRVLGNLSAEPVGDGVRLHGKIVGLEPGSRHGFHVHENANCGDGSDGFKAAGGHFSPEGHPHGAPSGEHHAGDLGNIEADGDGVAMVDIEADELELLGAHGVSGRTLVLHAEADDLTSQPSGDAGDRLACGKIDVRTR